MYAQEDYKPDKPILNRTGISHFTHFFSLRKLLKSILFAKLRKHTLEELPGLNVRF